MGSDASVDGPATECFADCVSSYVLALCLRSLPSRFLSVLYLSLSFYCVATSLFSLLRWCSFPLPLVRCITACGPLLYGWSDDCCARLYAHVFSFHRVVRIYLVVTIL